MPDLLKIGLTSPQIRTLVTVLGHQLGELVDPITMDVRRQDDLAITYLAMVRAQMTEAGWRPQGVDLAYWAVEALARVTTPPPAPKIAAAKKKAAPPAPKRRRADTRRRHDRPRTATTATEPALPMSDDLAADISDGVLP